MPKLKKTSHAGIPLSPPTRHVAEHVTVNQLIESLPDADRARLRAASTTVDLVLGKTLYEANTPLRYAYFPINGFISILSSASPNPREQLEFGLIGNEGMHGVSLALGVSQSSHCALVQGSGHALRISATLLQRELRRCPALQRVLKRYLHVLMQQQAQAAVCIGFHHIDQRLARWLLMAHDRAHVSTFRITHSFLSRMLGVRRAGVTQAAGALQQQGFIRYTHGRVTITDRRGLEAAACACYVRDLQTWTQWLS